MNSGQFIHNLILKMLCSSCKNILKIKHTNFDGFIFFKLVGALYGGASGSVCVRRYLKNVKFILQSGLLYFCSKNIRQINSHQYLKKVTKNKTKNYPK